MKFVTTFDKHQTYEDNKYDLSIPNVAYCQDKKDIHYTSYKKYGTIRFYVEGDITTPIKVKIYQTNDTFEEVDIRFV